MADNQITAAARDALTKVPQFLLRGVDTSKLRVVQAPPAEGYHAQAIASIDPKDPNTIRVHDMGAFLKPNAAAPLLAHELSHVQQTRAAGGGMKAFAPVNAADPYSFDENNLQGRHASKYSPEQLAQIVQNYTQAMNEKEAPEADRNAYLAKYQPTVSQFALMPQSVMQTDQSAQQPNTINTAPNAPAAQPALSGLPAENAPPDSIVPGSDDWEDVPSKGSGIQSSDSDWEDVSTPAIDPRSVDFLKGMGKEAASAVLGSNPLTGGLMQFDTHSKTIEGVKDALKSTNGFQTAGKLTTGIGELAAGAPDLDLAQGVKSLTAAGKARMGTLLDSNISTALHSDLGTALSKVAQEAGVEVEPTNDVRKVVGNVATAIREKAQAKLDEVDELFKGLSEDDAPAGLEHYSDIQAAITKKEKDLNMLRSSTPAKPTITTATSDAMSAAQKAEQKATAIRAEINALKGQKATADAALDAQGLQGARDQADRLFEQADALDKLRKAHAKSTFGNPGAGQTNPVKFHEQLSDLHDSGELHAALGEHNAQDLMDSTGRASRLMDRNAKIRKAGLVAAGIAGAGKLVSGAAHVSEFIP